MAAEALQALLEEGVRQGTFPAVQACVLHHGERLFVGHAGDCGDDSRFDLASVTKVVGTSTLFMALWERGLVAPETRLRHLLPQTCAGEATLEDLLCHRSGLPAWRPFFAHPSCTPALLEEGPSASRLAGSRAEVVAAALGCAPESPRGVRALYSDVGFILLGEALAAAAGAPLDALFAEAVAAPLGLQARFQRLSALPADAQRCVPTGRTRPREPAPGQEGLWAITERLAVPGEVDDDNAWAMDGVAGHAGLFSTATDVARLGQAVLEELEGAGRLASADKWRRALTRDTSVPGSTRALGFDTPSAEGSSGGRHLSPRAVGHLGFTGTSLWVDPVRALVVALLSNRTLPGRHNLGIRDFRPRFHDCVAAQLPPPSSPA